MMAVSTELKRPRFTQVPLHWIPIVVRANAALALPLLIVLADAIRLKQYSKFTGSARTRVAITAAIWASVGYPFTDKQRAIAGLPSASHKRRAMIAALKRIPDIVRVQALRRSDFKYVVHKGRWFDQEQPPSEA
jgi:hypothetical protein